MMFGSDILDIAVGLVFIYMLLSLLGSAISEDLESLIHVRANKLYEGLKELFRTESTNPNDPNKLLLEQFFKPPLIYSLYHGTFENRTRADGVHGNRILFPHETEENLLQRVCGEGCAVAFAP